jgi:formylglycine-generating enzyme required for sulfatase activity
MLTFFFGLIGITTFFVFKEAWRIEREKNLTRVANARYHSSMVWIPPGKFTMGGIGAGALPDELPLHDVRVDGFWMDKYEVTNAQWEKFVNATKYVTTAERPGLGPEAKPPGSACVRIDSSGGGDTWVHLPGANWKHPEGPGSNLQGRAQHPVVHVSFEDASAYCKWAGKRLPTEAEWEYAARGALVAQEFIWGAEKTLRGKWMANVWQGRFPEEQLDQDGFPKLAPVGSFPANNYGLFDMAGNVWEFTADWYQPDTYARLARNPEWKARRNPQGPDDESAGSAPAISKVVRGGAWTSGDQPNLEYRPSARHKLPVTATLQNTGFRCVQDRPPE